MLEIQEKCLTERLAFGACAWMQRGRACWWHESIFNVVGPWPSLELKRSRQGEAALPVCVSPWSHDNRRLIRLNVWGTVLLISAFLARFSTEVICQAPRMANWVWRGNICNISSMCTSSLNTAAASDRRASAISSRCAVFHFLPETRRDSFCVSCNLAAVLEEKIHSLEGQTLTLGDIRNAKELANKRRKKKKKEKRRLGS